MPIDTFGRRMLAGDQKKNLTKYTLFDNGGMEYIVSLSGKYQKITLVPNVSIFLNGQHIETASIKTSNIERCCLYLEIVLLCSLVKDESY